MGLIKRQFFYIYRSNACDSTNRTQQRWKQQRPGAVDLAAVLIATFCLRVVFSVVHSVEQWTVSSLCYQHR